MRPEHAATGRPPQHSRDEITAAAVAIADREGLDVVSMRRVATELGTGAASLYRYVDTREDLLDLMIDATGTEYLATAPTGDWLADLLDIGDQARVIMRRHPWLPSLLISNTWSTVLYLVPFAYCSDGKSQVSVEYVDGKPKRIDAVVVSTQHDDDVTTETLRAEVKKHIIDPIVPSNMVDSNTKYHINPTGRFVIGGPHGDTGLTGRKIIVDTYGGMGRHGGGAFSGKDPTKVDRSACYMARYVAKNMVAAGLAQRCEVQLAYAIGVAEPVSVMVNTFGTGTLPEERLVEIIRANFHLTPKGMIDSLKLRRPIYRKTASFGHFGRVEDTFSWEATDKAAALKEAAQPVAAARV